MIEGAPPSSARDHPRSAESGVVTWVAANRAIQAAWNVIPGIFNGIVEQRPRGSVVTPIDSSAVAMARSIYGALLEDNENFAALLIESVLAGAGAVAKNLEPESGARLETELVEIAAVLGAVAGLAANITRRATAAGLKL